MSCLTVRTCAPSFLDNREVMGSDLYTELNNGWSNKLILACSTSLQTLFHHFYAMGHT